MKRDTALLLVDFDATRSEQMKVSTAAQAEIISMYTKQGLPCPFDFVWNTGAGSQLSDISNVSAIFDVLSVRKCKTIFCCVCDQEVSTDRAALYAYIRELARMCGIKVVAMREVHMWHETHGPNGEPGPEGVI